jgi:hypothetical protein
MFKRQPIERSPPRNSELSRFPSNPCFDEEARRKLFHR